MASQPKISMKWKRNVLSVLTLVQKIEILDKIKSGDSVTCYRKYEMNESSVREIRKNEVKILRSVMESAPISNKTCNITRDGGEDRKALNIWIEDQIQKKSSSQIFSSFLIYYYVCIKN